MNYYSNMQQNTYEDLESIPVAVDCIIYGFNENNLELLLIHRGFEPEKDKWSVMGGFVNKDEDIDAAASRVLKTLTGLENIFMEQVNTFGKVNRDPGGRVISVSYYALIRNDQYDEKLVKKHKAKWFPLNDLPSMIFDHKDMAQMAIKRLQRKVKSEAIGFNLLPEKFTLPQLQTLYEAILGEEIDKRNFRKKITTMDFIVKLEEKDKSSSKRGAFLYKFDSEKYKTGTGINFF
ncbi:MAG: NUDIX hydrolase [Reichenbachiella sp.]